MKRLPLRKQNQLQDQIASAWGVWSGAHGAMNKTAGDVTPVPVVLDPVDPPWVVKGGPTQRQCSYPTSPRHITVSLYDACRCWTALSDMKRTVKDAQRAIAAQLLKVFKQTVIL